MNWDELYRIVDAARELESREQEDFIVADCGEDSELLELVRLILTTSLEDDFLEPPPLGKLGTTKEMFRIGEFLVTEELARGDMGAVYLGAQEGLDHQVVIKVLSQSQRLRTAVFSRFQREVAAASSVQHPHVVPVLSAGDTDGNAWYAMSYIDGHNLARELELQRERSKDKIWPAFGSQDYVVQVIRQVICAAEALQHIHDLGIVHQGISPHSMLLNRDGQLFVTDFGLAKIQTEDSRTDTTEIQSTPNYMSPEQTRALRRTVDHRTDVYSLSVVLFELLSLKRPIEGTTPESVRHKIATAPQASLRDANARAPRDLVTICEKGMAHNPSRRYATAMDLATDLRHFISLEAITAQPAPWHRAAESFARSHRKKLGLVGILASMTAAWFAYIAWQQS